MILNKVNRTLYLTIIVSSLPWKVGNSLGEFKWNKFSKVKEWEDIIGTFSLTFQNSHYVWGTHMTWHAVCVGITHAHKRQNTWRASQLVSEQPDENSSFLSWRLLCSPVLLPLLVMSSRETFTAREAQKQMVRIWRGMCHAPGQEEMVPVGTATLQKSSAPISLPHGLRGFICSGPCHLFPLP